VITGELSAAAGPLVAAAASADQSQPVRPAAIVAPADANTDPLTNSRLEISPDIACPSDKLQ
jgi:hypothetical protein